MVVRFSNIIHEDQSFFKESLYEMHKGRYLNSNILRVLAFINASKNKFDNIITWVTACVFLLSFIQAAISEEIGKPTIDLSQNSHGYLVEKIRALLRTDARCIEFTDSCSICTREGDDVFCSTIQIACIRSEWKCTKILKGSFDEN